MFTTCLPGALTSEECIRVSELELRVVLSHCMGAGSRTLVLCKGNKVLLTVELQFPELFWFVCFCIVSCCFVGVVGRGEQGGGCQ